MIVCVMAILSQYLMAQSVMLIIWFHMVMCSVTKVEMMFISRDTPTGKCSFRYNAVDHHAHFLYCTQAAVVEYWKIRRNLLINQMEKLCTCPAIIFMVTRILSHGGSKVIEHNIKVNGRVELFVSTAMSEQFKIGWTAFIQGFHSSHWMITQNEYCSDEGFSSYVSTGTGNVRDV